MPHLSPVQLRTFLGGLAVLVGFQLLYYFPQLFEGREYFLSDHTFFFEPLADLIGESFREGRLALWNPYCYCGMSQLANPSPGLFFFPNLLFAVCSYSKALVLIQCLHEIVAYIAGFSICCLLEMGAPAALMVGLGLSFNGYFLSLPSNYTLPGTFAWGALAMCALMAVKRRALSSTILLTLSVHWMLMAGRPEIYVPWFITYGLVILLMVLRQDFLVEPHPHHSPRKVLFLQVLALGLAVLLSMISLVPVYEWTKLSPRASGLDTVQIFYWSSNWYDFLGMLLFQPLGDLQRPNAYLSGYVASRPGYYPFLPSAYLGPVFISLSIFGVFDKPFKERFYFLAAAVIATVLALGCYTPFAAWLIKLVPIFAVLRYPCKLLIFVLLFLVLLAGGGLRAVLTARAPAAPKLVNLSLWTFGTLLGVIFLVYPKVVNFFGGHTELVHALGRPLLVMCLIGLLFNLVISLSRLCNLKQAMPMILLAAFCSNLFVPAMQHRQSTVAPGYFAKQSGLALKLQALTSTPQKGPASAGKVLPPRLLTLYGDPLKVGPGYECRPNAAAGESFMQFARELLLPDTNIDFRWPVSFGYEAGETKDYRNFYLSAYRACSAYRKPKQGMDQPLGHFCKLTSTSFVASHIVGNRGPINKLDSSLFKIVDEDKRLNIRLYQYLEPLPRAYLTSAFREAEASRFVEDLLADRWSNCSQVVIDPLDNWKPLSDIDHRPHLDSDGPSLEINQEDVQFLQDKAEHVALSVKAPRACFLVLNDRYYPGWQARVDSQPVTLHRADAFMRAVFLEKGSHLVEFDYKPESLEEGFYLFLVGLAGLLLLIIWACAAPFARMVRFLSTGS